MRDEICRRATSYDAGLREQLSLQDLAMHWPGSRLYVCRHAPAATPPDSRLRCRPVSMCGTCISA